MKTVLIAVTTILSLVLLTLIGIRVGYSIGFKQNCSGHLKRAADANSVELAKQELKTALDYMEANDLKSGYTSIFYRTPDEDVGFWYINIKASYDQLVALRPDTTQAEKDMVLLKLRQTLLDHNEQGESVTVPNGISMYPRNTLFFSLFMLVILLTIVSGAGIIVADSL